MTNDEARTLARRIIDTWPTAAKGYIWQETLTDLDHTQATRTYHQLRTEATTRPPTPGQFLAVYYANGPQPEQRHGPHYDPAEGPLTGPSAEYLAVVKRLRPETRS